MNRIPEIRKGRQMTQQELANAAGISRTGLSLIETGATNPKIETIKKIAAALSVDWQTLVCD